MAGKMNPDKQRLGRIDIFLTVVLGFCLGCGCGLPGGLQAEPGKSAAPMQADLLAEKELPAFEDDMQLLRLGSAIESSLQYFERLPAGRQFEFEGHRFRADKCRQVLKRFSAFIQTDPSEEALRKWIARHFRVYAVSRGDVAEPVLYTGYYMPVLKGSREKSGPYQHPIYARPEDLVTFDPSDFSESCPQRQMVGRVTGKTVVPYYSRRTIQNTDVLSDTATPILWVDDPVALFFLHVQGSGMVCLESGELINVHYAASNGLGYKSIGKYLIESGKIARKDLTMQSIRAYLAAHPQECPEILARNPRYVFFKEEAGGPVGCLSVELTPGRSIALDQEAYPPGVPALIQSRKPVLGPGGEVKGWESFSRLVLNQDTGDAIRGMNRVDIFWGGGRYAEAAAGRMKEPGRLYMLLPK